MSLVF